MSDSDCFEDLEELEREHLEFCENLDNEIAKYGTNYEEFMEYYSNRFALVIEDHEAIDVSEYNWLWRDGTMNVVICFMLTTHFSGNCHKEFDHVIALLKYFDVSCANEYD